MRLNICVYILYTPSSILPYCNIYTSSKSIDHLWLKLYYILNGNISFWQENSVHKKTYSNIFFDSDITP